jgi:glucose-1-phosphate cytidylyltransferase
MKIYSHYGFNQFILCLGYQGHQIKEYFLDYKYLTNDFTLTIGSKTEVSFHNSCSEDWTITFAETGLETNTGGRIKHIEKYIQTDFFLATYADGLADIDISRLVAFHKEQGKIATMTSVRPFTNFGIVDLDESGMALGFREKPQQEEWINGGFFVFNKEFLNYLDEDSVLEADPLGQLVRKRQLAVFKHDGFWKCMDTFKDVQALNQIWKNTTPAPWEVWSKQRQSYAE